MEDIKTFIHNVRLNIGKIQHIQSVLAAQKSKVSLESHLVDIISLYFQDTHQVDGNLDRINFWSCVHMLIMLVVGFTQVCRKLLLFTSIFSSFKVFMLKQLFEDKSVVKKFVPNY